MRPPSGIDQSYFGKRVTDTGWGVGVSDGSPEVMTFVV